MKAVVFFVYHAAAVAIDILGLVVLAVGALLLFFAWRASNAPLEQMSEALTGRYSNSTIWYLVGGVVDVVAGAALLFRGSIRD
jgi:hypothetical protein